MKRLCEMIVGLGLVVCLAMPVPAQKQKGKNYCGISYLLFYKGIEEELKLSKEQLAKAKAVAEERAAKFQEKFDEARKDKDGQSIANVYRVATEETNKALAKILTPAQMKRLSQIEMQNYFYTTLLDPANAKLLNFTPEQLAKIEPLSRLGGPGMSAAEKNEWHEKGLAILTPEQKKAWESLVGPPYIFRR
jgi:hypothetical protein